LTGTKCFEFVYGKNGFSSGIFLCVSNNSTAIRESERIFKIGRGSKTPARITCQRGRSNERFGRNADGRVAARAFG
jgi:hypothetical protein